MDILASPISPGQFSSSWPVNSSPVHPPPRAKVRLQDGRPEEALEDTLKVLQGHPEDFLATCLKVGKQTSSRGTFLQQTSY